MPSNICQWIIPSSDLLQDILEFLLQNGQYFKKHKLILLRDYAQNYHDSTATV